MTWHHHRIWIVTVLLASGLVLVWLIAKTSLPPLVPVQNTATTTTSDLTGRAIYTNGEYGFVVSYPQTARLEDTFGMTYHLPSTWRVNADPEANGEAIVAIVAYSTESDHSYPRYFHALVRIGASNDPKELANCGRVTPDRGEKMQSDVVFGGATWKVFSFEQAGVQQYARGMSYRTLHEGACIAVEKIAAGASYQDDPESPDDVADEILIERYAGLDQIVESFMFAR